MATTFSLQHEFPKIPLDVFEAHLNDPKLNQMLEQGLGFDERTLIEERATKDGTNWLFLVKKCGDMPKALQKILKEDGLSWHESSRFVRAEHCIYWEINPESKLIKFNGKGVWKLSPLKNGCKRIIEGTISVDIPLVGKMVESFIVNELVKTYEIEPSIQQKFYASVMKKSAHAR